MFVKAPIGICQRDISCHPMKTLEEKAFTFSTSFEEGPCNFYGKGHKKKIAHINVHEEK